MPLSTDADAKLTEIVRSILQLPPDVDIAGARQLAVETWDSLAHVSLMLALESEFGISIDIADQITLTSVPAIRLYLQERAA